MVFSVPYYFFYEEKFSIARVDDISPALFWDVLNLYIISNIAFIFGFLLYHQISTTPIRKVYRSDLNHKLFSSYKIPNYFQNIAYVLTLIIIICYVFTYGDLLLYRKEYIPVFEQKFLITLAKILSLIVSILLGLVYNINRAMSILLITILILFTFGTGSRVTFLLLFLYFLTIFQMSGNTKANKRRFIIQVVISFIFLSYLISLRQLNEYGIIPYLSALFQEDSKILDSIFFNIYYSFIFGLFATARTLSESESNWHYIYISLNPLPGSMVGWPSLSKELMITKFMPYTLHGQVFKMGYSFLISFFLTLGIIFAYFEKVIRKYLIRGKKRIALVFALILALFVFYSYEYHLRSAVRYIYYAFFILIVIKISNYLYRIIKSNVKVGKKIL